MKINGIDLDGLAAQTGTLPNRAVVPGRVVHVDGDFLAYHCSYEKPDEPKTLDEIFHNIETSLETLKGAAGASKYTIHLTPKESNKGNRYNIALLKGYGENRKDKPKPRFLHLAREMMHVKLHATMHRDAEADDGMAAAQYAAIAAGNENLSIIATKDKDLRMVPGLHLEWATGDIKTAKGFGWLDFSGEKLVGWGTKWFWAQMLMGDSVDNIGGLPLVYQPVLNKLDPTNDVKKALEKLAVDPDNAAAKKKLIRNPKPCGPVMTCRILEEALDDKVAFAIVKALYKYHEDHGEGYQNYRDGSKVTWQQAMISHMKLLWMRRTPNNENDVLEWLKEVTL